MTWYLHVEEELLASRQIRAVAKMLYAYLRFRQGNNGRSWPALDTISRDLGVSKNTIIKARAELEKVGLILTEKGEQTGRSHNNHYGILDFEIWQRKGSDPEPFVDAQKGSYPERKGFRSCTERVQILHPINNTKLNKRLNKGAREASTGKPVCPDGPKAQPIELPLPGVVEAPITPPIAKGSSRAESTARFDRFWGAYPRKVARKKCLAIWLALKLTDEQADQVVAAVKRYCQTDQWQKEGGKFIPHPSTFLNQGRWEDEIETKPKPKRGDLDWDPSIELGVELQRSWGSSNPYREATREEVEAYLANEEKKRRGGK